MRVQIKHSIYAEVPVGTYGTLVKPHEEGWEVAITKSFTVPGAQAETKRQTRSLFFEFSEINFTPLPEPTDKPTETQQTKSES